SYSFHYAGKISRDTQTATCKEKLQNTTYDASTQMARADHFVPRESDKILSTGKFTSVDDYDKVDYDKMAIIIQRHWRGYAARKKFKEMLASYRQFLMWDQTEAERLERERHNRLRKEIVHKVFPRTRADYEMLYAMIENWRKAEIKRISSMKTTVPKKAEFCLLLQKEIESLRTIEKYRLELKKEKMAKKELDILEKCATPITWTGYKGIEVSMETIHIQRAKELKELYYIMCQNDISVEERIELLVSLKYALKSYNPMMTNELISLFEREVNCLVRGVKAKDLILLRLRTQKLFIELMKDPEFNPEAAKHTVFDWEENVGKMYFCQRCQTLKPMTDFAVFDKKLDKCISCAWLDDIGRTRIDFQPYRFIIRALQREERRRKCFTSMAFIMQDKDFYYLIVQIWHCKSALSEETDISKLCLGRWDVSNDWTPWNSVLLTTSEMKAHVNLDDFHKVSSITIFFYFGKVVK
ncbi:IQ and ubiquitin-like domain-containing protein, partial [Blattella germanica]